MHRGQIIMTGTPAEIKKAMPGVVYDFYCADAPAAYRLLRTKLPATSLVLYGDRLRLWTDKGALSAQETASWLRNEHIQNVTLTETEPSLEDAFVALLGQRQSEEERRG